MFRIIGLICLSTLLTTNPQRGYSEEPLIGTVTGTVVSESGAPVAGADVLILLDDQPELLTSPKQLLVQGTSDADGAFAIPVLASLVFNRKIHRCDEIQVWVSHPAAGWALTRSEERLPHADLSLKLNDPEPESLEVLAPDGLPASGVEVAVRAVRAGKEFIAVPKMLRDRFKATTDAEGHIELPGVSRQELLCADFHSEKFGTQRLYWLSDEQFTEQVTLRPVASVTGQVTGDLPAGRSFDELSIRLSTRPLPKAAYYLPEKQCGIATVPVKSDGTFSAPVLATGMLTIEVQFPDNFPAFALSPEGWYLSAGSQVSVEVALERARRVTGLVVDAETREPIPDVRLSFPYGQCRPAHTDAQGEFVTYCAPSGARQISVRAPETHCAPQDWRRDDYTIPGGVTDFELPPLELIRCTTVTGTVKDSVGDPLSEIEVVVDYRDNLNSETRRSQTVSDKQGQFELQGVSPNAPVSIRARLDEIALTPTIWNELDQMPQPIELTVDLNRVALSGRIVDEAGRPVPNADYQISVILDDEKRWTWVMEGTELKALERMKKGSEQAHSGRTDAAGEFRTPKEFLASGMYYLYPTVKGRSVGHRGPLQPSVSGTGRFDDVVQKIEPEVESSWPEPPTPGTFTGLVANRDGDAVPGAKVVLWALNKRLLLRTDRSGRFQIRDLSEDGVWLFVEAEGYRFFGEYTVLSDEVHRIALTRSDEPAGEPMETITDPVDEEVLAKASRELMGFMERCHERGYRGHKHELMELLPRLDPDLALKCLEDPRFDASDMNNASNRERQRNGVLWSASNQYVKYDAGKAADAARLMTLGTYRVSALCNVADQLPDSERELRNGLLTDALSTARAIESPPLRLEGLVTVARTLIDVGETKRGQIVLHEAIRVAQKPFPRVELRERERGEFFTVVLAWHLAPFDLEGALELLPQPLDKYNRCRYYGNIAHQIADVNPAEAVRIFERFPDSRSGGWLIRVCYRMAKTDYERARALSESLGPYLRAYSWGVMAQAVADDDPEKAKELIEQAYDALDKLADIGSSEGSRSDLALKYGVCLLPVVEQVDPDRLREYFWRAFSYRRNYSTQSTQILGAFLARYDREVAERLIRPRLEHPPYYPDEWQFIAGSGAVIDPGAAVDYVVALPEKEDHERRLKIRIWEELITMLTRRGEESWNWLQDRKYYVWRIGEFDL